MTLITYRLCSGNYKTEWRVAVSQKDVDNAVKQTNVVGDSNDKDEWTAETITVTLDDFEAKHLAEQLMGSIKSKRRAAASASNGRKGGRPRVDINQNIHI